MRHKSFHFPKANRDYCFSFNIKKSQSLQRANMKIYFSYNDAAASLEIFTSFKTWKIVLFQTLDEVFCMFPSGPIINIRVCVETETAGRYFNQNWRTVSFLEIWNDFFWIVERGFCNYDQMRLELSWLCSDWL